MSVDTSMSDDELAQLLAIFSDPAFWKTYAKTTEAIRSGTVFAEQMVPGGRYGEDETRRRREIWKLFINRPATVPPRFMVGPLAKHLGESEEWVGEVLNLPSGNSVV
jgi:hypothetical protein